MSDLLPCRIVKADTLNVCVEVYREVKSGKDKGKMRWMEEGYFGHNLSHAAKWALASAFDTGAVITPDAVERACAGIVEQTRGILEEKPTASLRGGLVVGSQGAIRSEKEAPKARGTKK